MTAASVLSKCGICGSSDAGGLVVKHDLCGQVFHNYCANAYVSFWKEGSYPCPRLDCHKIVVLQNGKFVDFPDLRHASPADISDDESSISESSNEDLGDFVRLNLLSDDEEYDLVAAQKIGHLLLMAAERGDAATIHELLLIVDELTGFCHPNGPRLDVRIKNEMNRAMEIAALGAAEHGFPAIVKELRSNLRSHSTGIDPEAADVIDSMLHVWACEPR
jgi:hypothetical protein